MLWQIVVASNGNQQELIVDTAADVLHRHIYYIGVARQTVLLLLQLANYLRHGWNT